MKNGDPGVWAEGTVTAHHCISPQMPVGVLAPYQVKRSTGHTHTHTERENTTPDTDTHTQQERHPKPPNEHLPHTRNNAGRWRDD